MGQLKGAALGKPLIASVMPGSREILDNSVIGFLFNVKSVKDLEKNC